MSRRESLVEVGGYIDTEYSSGDSNKKKTKQLYREENNNEVDELSKELSEMGCVVDAMKRPPNICVETCVYESEEENPTPYDEEDAYSDEFEEDKSDGEEESVKTESKSEKSASERTVKSRQSTVKHSKSQSSISSKGASVSGRSDYGSVSVPPTRRINMSFTNSRLREIERHNHILLSKIMSARNVRKSSIPPREQSPRKPSSSAAVMRKKQQKQIDHDNMVLLKKIQRAKSSACSLRR